MSIRPLCFVIMLWFLAVGAWAAEEEASAEPAPKPAEAIQKSLAPKAVMAPEDLDWRPKLENALAQPITAEFEKADLEWVMNTLFVMTGVPVNLDPDAVAALSEHKRQLTIRAEGIPLKDVLTWIGNATQLKWKLADRAVYMYLPEEAKERLRKEEGSRASLGAASSSAASGNLRVKLPNGAEVEADATYLKSSPDLAEAFLERALDSAADGLAVYHWSDEGGVSMEEFRALAAKVAPKAKLDFDSPHKLLLVTSDEPAQVRRIGTLIRALKVQPVVSKP